MTVQLLHLFSRAVLSSGRIRDLLFTMLDKSLHDIEKVKAKDQV